LLVCFPSFVVFVLGGGIVGIRPFLPGSILEGKASERND